MLGATDRPRLGRWSIALVCATIALSGCSAAQSAPTTNDQSDLIASLNEAVVKRDRSSFDAAFASESPVGQRDQLWSNITQLPLVTFSAAEDGLRVEWRVPGDIRSAWHLISAPSDCDQGNCVFTALEPKAQEPAPIWLVEPVQIHRGDGWSVIQGASARSWSAAVAAARGELLAADLSPLSSDWDSELAVVVPGTKEGFEAVLGATADEFAATGALTWVADFGLEKLDGAQPAANSAAVRIVTNPATTSTLGDDGLRLLITHEGVHVATNSLGLPAAGRAWVSEGLAETVAMATQPRHAARLVDLLKGDCEMLAEPPADASFSGGVGQDAALAELSYARAWALVTRLEDKLGRIASRDDLIRLWRGDDPQGVTIDELTTLATGWCLNVKA